MRHLSIAAVLGLAATGLLLAENKKTVKAPKGANEYAVKKSLKNGVELGLKMKRKGVAGDPLTLKVSVANKGKKVVEHGPTDGGYRDVRIKIVHSSGKEAKPWPCPTAPHSNRRLRHPRWRRRRS